MRWIDSIDSLDFDDHRAFDEDVDKECVTDFDTVIIQVDWSLALEPQLRLCQLDGQAFFIHSFEKSRTKLRMNPNRCADNLFSNRIDVHSARSASSAATPGWLAVVKRLLAAIVYRLDNMSGRGLMTW